MKKEKITKDAHEQQALTLFHQWLKQERGQDDVANKSTFHTEEYGIDVYGFLGPCERSANGWADHIVVIKHEHDNGGISSIYHIVGFHALLCADGCAPVLVFQDGVMVPPDTIDFFYIHIEYYADTGATLYSRYAQSWYEDDLHAYIEDIGCIMECFFFFLEHVTLISEKTFAALHPAIPSRIIHNPLFFK